MSRYCRSCNQLFSADYISELKADEVTADYCAECLDYGIECDECGELTTNLIEREDSYVCQKCDGN